MPQHVTGYERVLKAISKARTEDAIKIAEGLKKCAEVVYRKSQQYVPVETGALKKSGRVEVNDKAGMAAEASVVYGSEEAYYALYVHEDMTKNHAPPTCAQFLTRALRETRGTCSNILKREFEGRPVKTIDGDQVD